MSAKATRVTYTPKAYKLRRELIEFKNTHRTGKENADYLDTVLTLENDLRATQGKPLNRGWQSVGPLKQIGKDVWHCHLDKKNVAIWKILKTESGIECRIGYIGLRSEARY
jgi:hypothetical protein